jgi:hypothetical protein
MVSDTHRVEPGAPCPCRAPCSGGTEPACLAAIHRFLRDAPLRHDAARQPVTAMATTRRAFLGSAAASSAAFTVNGPLALAAGPNAGTGSRTAGLVISALATDPSNCLQQDRNWTSVAETRFGQGLADRRAIDGLRDEIPDLELLSPQEIAQWMAELLLPGYEGPRSITRAEAEAELAKIQGTCVLPSSRARRVPSRLPRLHRQLSWRSSRRRRRAASSDARARLCER